MITDAFHPRVSWRQDTEDSHPRRIDPVRRSRAVAEGIGFMLVRTNGSHCRYRHTLVPRILSVQPRGKEAKSYQIEQFVAMVEEYGLKLDA